MSNEAKTFQLVVGYDFSPQAELALEQSLMQCKLHDSNVLHVLGVLDSSRGLGPFGGDGGVNFDAAQEAQEKIAQRVSSAIEDAGLETVTHFVHTRIGNPAKELIGLSDETGADLIVVGTHGRKGVSRLFMGSVAEQVVRHGTCPVLVVRPSMHPAEEIEESMRPEPPCPQCVAKRKETNGAEWWCDVHSKKHDAPHPVGQRRGHVAGAMDAWTRFNR